MAAVPSAANWVAKNAGMKWLKVGLTYIGNAAIAGTTSAVTEKVSNPQATSEDIRNVAFRGAIWSSVGTTAGYLVGKIPLISNISKTAEYDLWRVTPMGGVEAYLGIFLLMVEKGFRRVITVEGGQAVYKDSKGKCRKFPVSDLCWMDMSNGIMKVLYKKEEQIDVYVIYAHGVKEFCSVVEEVEWREPED